MENSKKEEAFVEVDNSRLTSSADPSGVCEKYLYDYLEEGVHETFDFKMKDIKKYSTGLVSILFISLGMDLLLVLVIIISICCHLNDAIVACVTIHTILSSMLSTLNLIFFILFSVYYYKGKIKDFEDFSECDFFIESFFRDTFSYIFIVYDNCKKVFITDLIFICLNCCSTIISAIINKKND